MQLVRNFPEAVHVRCFRHLQQNIESHLREQQFSSAAIAQYTHDIFGWRDSDGEYHEGLVDCDNISCFDSSLLSLKSKWDQLEQDDFHDRVYHKAGFYDWFTRYKADDFRHCTLRSLREDIGLGSPPSAFRTNDSESINALLKESLGYKKHQWGVFNEKVKKVVKQQQQDMSKAIIGHGQYQICPQYSFLSVSGDKWFWMSEEQRLNWIKKFNACQVQECANTSFLADESSAPSRSTEDSSPDISIGRFACHDKSSMSVTIKDIVSSTGLAYATVEGM